MSAVATKPLAKKAKASPAASPATPVTEVAAALLSLLDQACETYNAGKPDTVCVHAHTLADMAREEAGKLAQGGSQDESDSTYRIAACIAGARAYDMVDCPSCEARHALLLQAYELAESASISFGFEQGPCEGLATGIKAGRATQPDAVDQETAAMKAMALNLLVDWISEARSTLDRIRNVASISSELHDVLSAFEIPYSSPEWNEGAGDGVTFVLGYQRECISQLAGGAV